MAKRIKLTRPDSVQGSAREYLFKLAGQVEKEINEILAEAQKTGEETEKEISLIDEKLRTIEESIENINEKIKAIEESIEEL